MHYFITADTHFGHQNIIGYTGRPFRDIDHMNTELIRRYNERIKPEDTCFILGDFCFRGTGGAHKADHWMSQLHGDKIVIRGNHDNNNSCKTIIRKMVIRFAGVSIGMTHDPVDHMESTTYNHIDLNLCGHVHQHWTTDWRSGIPLINVGVDRWNFYPQRLDEILVFAQKYFKDRMVL